MRRPPTVSDYLVEDEWNDHEMFTDDGFHNIKGSAILQNKVEVVQSSNMITENTTDGQEDRNNQWNEGVNNAKTDHIPQISYPVLQDTPFPLDVPAETGTTQFFSNIKVEKLFRFI